jgi:VDE lipocalin domain
VLASPLAARAFIVIVSYTPLYCIAAAAHTLKLHYSARILHSSDALAHTHLHTNKQECATRCFAQYGGPKLDAWLTCTLEDHECVKIPKDLDFSVIDKNPPKTLSNFNPEQLAGTWYKVLGVNPKYDLFDCQRNIFTLNKATSTAENSADAAQLPQVQTADLGVEFRLSKPAAAGGGFWQNRLNEQLEVDAPGGPRTFHTEGKMFGLTFRENW